MFTLDSESVNSAVMLTVIAYPMVFVVMGVFVALTYWLNKIFPGE